MREEGTILITVYVNIVLLQILILILISMPIILIIKGVVRTGEAAVGRTKLNSKGAIRLKISTQRLKLIEAIGVIVISLSPETAVTITRAVVAVM